MEKIRVNLANPQELQVLTGFDQATVDTILHHRAEHGPIGDPLELARIVGGELPATLVDRLDFAPAGETAPEAPGG